MIKLFYYLDDTQNLVKEQDAVETSLSEVIDEVFNLPEDNKSYIGVIVNDNTKYKIKSDAYNSYIMYGIFEGENDYRLLEFGDFENCKNFLGTLTIS